MSAHYHTDFHPHVKPARGAPALVRRLRGRLVRRKVYRYRLPAHRTEHEAGHQPAERRGAEGARRSRAPRLPEAGITGTGAIERPGTANLGRVSPVESPQKARVLACHEAPAARPAGSPPHSLGVTP